MLVIMVELKPLGEVTLIIIRILKTFKERLNQAVPLAVQPIRKIIHLNKI